VAVRAHQRLDLLGVAASHFAGPICESRRRVTPRSRLARAATWTPTAVALLEVWVASLAPTASESN
jgi:hypothetical protein